jgi:hypothetical protein
VFVCTTHDVATTRLAYDPFSAEIYGKKHLVKCCEPCLDESRWDI